MSTTHNLPYTRFTRQVSTDPMALLSTNVAAAAAAQLLQTAPWVEQTEETPTFPPRAAMLTAGTPSVAFDAYKYVGDYADGKQVAYCGAVAYRFQIPAAGLTGPTDITSIALPIYVDRWLVDGVRIAAYLSDSPSPPGDWTTIRAGDTNAADVLPMTYTDPAGDRIVIEKNGTTTLTWPAATGSKKYIYVLLTLEDYTTTRGFWIEGSALIQGAEAVTTFAASVAADTDPYGGYKSPIATADLVYVADDPVAHDGKIGPFRASGSTYAPYGVMRFINLITPDANYLFTLADWKIRLSALVNQALFFCDSHISSSTLFTDASANFFMQATSDVAIATGMYMLTARFDSAVPVQTIAYESAISSYPDYLRYRLNVYLQPVTSLYADDADLATVSAYSDDSSWRLGTYASNGLVNLLSVELSPVGYAAGHVFGAKGVSFGPGLYRVYITGQLSEVLPSLPDSGIDSSSTKLDFKTYRLLFNR